MCYDCYELLCDLFEAVRADSLRLGQATVISDYHSTSTGLKMSPL